VHADRRVAGSADHSGGLPVRFGVPLADVYLEFLAGRCRPNTVLAAGYDLKVFFSVVGKASSRYEGNAVDWFLEQFLVAPGQSDGDRMRWDPWRDLPVVNLITRPGPGGPAERRAGFSRGWSLGSRKTRRYFIEDCASTWQDVGQLAGTRLRWHGSERGELRTAQEHTIASRRIRTAPLVITDVLRAGDSNFTVSGEMGPGRFVGDAVVTKIAAQRYQDRDAHFTISSRESARTGWPRVAGLTALVDETGRPVLWITGSNYAFKASARITFPDERWLRFLVRGTRERNGIMTAVDQAGNKVIRFRRGGAYRDCGTDVVVHPERELTEELVLAIAMSAGWLHDYFQTSSGGG
jgi:hypothetical protein